MASPHASESRIDGTGPRMLIIVIVRRKMGLLFDLASLSTYPAMDYPPPARLPLQAILDKAPVQVISSAEAGSCARARYPAAATPLSVPLFACK